jgi:hypothetical protein
MFAQFSTPGDIPSALFAPRFYQKFGCKVIAQAEVVGVLDHLWTLPAAGPFGRLGMKSGGRRSGGSNSL